MPVIIEKRRIPSRRPAGERPETREEKMISSLSPHVNIMVKAARKAGSRMLRDFGEVSQLQVSQKGPGSFVSNADIMAEKTLIELLKEDRPDYGFLSEECGAIEAQNNSPFRWIIDPIDGTTNFLHALPVFAISIALMEKDEVIAGIIFNPITNELYHAEKGKGAFLMTPTGNRRLRVSGRNKMSHALVGSNSFYNPQNREIMIRISEQVASCRYNGSAVLSLASVAAGQLDAYVATQIKLWDLAVGFLLVREAGGSMSDFAGGMQLQDIMASQNLVASNFNLKNTLLKIVRD